MKKILTINIFSNKFQIILQNNEKLIDNIIINEENKQSDLLVLKIKQLLNKNNLSYKDIDCLSITNGPGSFTALKATMTFAKVFHLCFPEKYIILNNIFEIISFREKNFDFVILESNLNYYYLFNKNKFLFVKQNELLDIIQNGNKIITNSKILMDFLKTNCNIFFIEQKMEDLIELNFFKCKNNIFSIELEPLYIREPDINLKK